METIADAVNRGAIFKFLSKPLDGYILRDTVDEAFRHCESMQHFE